MSDVIKYGLLIGTPRACLDIEEFLFRDRGFSPSFVTFNADTLTKNMYGMSEQDFVFTHCCNMVVHHPSSTPGRSPQDSFPSAPFSPVSVQPKAASSGSPPLADTSDKHVVVIEVKVCICSHLFEP